MTRQKITTGLALTILPIVFGAGAGITAAQAKVDAGLTAARVKADALADRVEQTGQKVDRIDARVAEMYCASIPLSRRAGCR